jgi:hypothetical protein
MYGLSGRSLILSLLHRANSQQIIKWLMIDYLLSRTDLKVVVLVLMITSFLRDRVLYELRKFYTIYLKKRIEILRKRAYLLETAVLKSVGLYQYNVVPHPFFLSFFIQEENDPDRFSPLARISPVSFYIYGSGHYWFNERFGVSSTNHYSGIYSCFAQAKVMSRCARTYPSLSFVEVINGNFSSLSPERERECSSSLSLERVREDLSSRSPERVRESMSSPYQELFDYLTPKIMTLLSTENECKIKKIANVMAHTGYSHFGTDHFEKVVISKDRWEHIAAPGFGIIIGGSYENGLTSAACFLQRHFRELPLNIDLSSKECKIMGGYFDRLDINENGTGSPVHVGSHKSDEFIQVVVSRAHVLNEHGPVNAEFVRRYIKFRKIYTDNNLPIILVIDNLDNADECIKLFPPETFTFRIRLENVDHYQLNNICTEIKQKILEIDCPHNHLIITPENVEICKQRLKEYQEQYINKSKTTDRVMKDVVSIVAEMCVIRT